jgi:hypothetical protein
MKAHVITHTNPNGSIESLRVFIKELDADKHYNYILQKDRKANVVWGRTEIEGFESYLETHYEMVQAITIEHIKDEPQGVVRERHDEQGHGGLYELAEELTDKFEKENELTQWDGDFFETIEQFTKHNLK